MPGSGSRPTPAGTSTERRFAARPVNSSALELAVSPYHLATREAPAMLALVLGSAIVTLLPRPSRGDTLDGVRSTVAKAPRYLRLMESWRWCGELWKSGLIRSDFAGESPADGLDDVYASIADDDAFSALRPLTRGAQQRTAESADKALDFIAGDMLRGGPDPGINIPVSAALDRFAVRHKLCVVRSGAASVAQRVESKLARKVFSVAMPILLRAGGGRVAMLRDDLVAPLEDVRSALAPLLRSIRQDAAPTRTELERLAGAAAAYARAFERWSPTGATGDDENDERITTGYVSVAGVVMPADAVLRSSRAAVRAIRGDSAPDEDPLEDAGGRLLALVVREMNVQPIDARS